MTEAHHILARLLGQITGTFVPPRDPMSPRWGNAHAAQATYRDGGGVPWTTGQRSGGAGQKAVEAALQELVEAGLAERVKGLRSAKTVRVRLTDAGEWHARALCGLISPADSLDVARIVIGLESGPEATAGNGEDEAGENGDGGEDRWLKGWIAEEVITGVPWGDPRGDGANGEFVILEDVLSSALTRGFVEALSDREGRVYYRSTKAGRAAARKKLVPPAGKLPRFRRAALAEWDRSAGQTIRQMDEARPDGRKDRETGPIPLPCSLLRAKDLASRGEDGQDEGVAL